MKPGHVMRPPNRYRETLFVVIVSILWRDDRNSLVESFCQYRGRGRDASPPVSEEFFPRMNHHHLVPPVRPSTSCRSTQLFQTRQSQSRRWNGNYKHRSQKLSDVPKKKKLMLNLTANGITKTLEKKRMETLQHVLTKAMIWKLFMVEHPFMEIEMDIGDPDYLPDVVGTMGAMTGNTTIHNTEITFWGESGRMKVHKALDLMRRYPSAHIVHCRWGIDLASFMEPFIEYLETELADEDTSWWSGRFSFASLPLEVWEFVDEETGTILIEKKDLVWKELDIARLNFASTDTDNVQKGK